MNIRALVARPILRVVNQLGYDIVPRKKQIPLVPPDPIATLISHYSIDTVIDIGANEGQFALNLRSKGYNGLIISVEPLSQAFQKLKLAATADPLWETHQCAIGTVEGNIEINIASNSVSSSILPMCRKHEESAPASSYIGKEIVPIRTLDSLCEQRLGMLGRIFLKIDVQGYERHVLLGANKTFVGVIGILIETSIVPLYLEAISLQEVLDFMNEKGFLLHHVERVFWDERTQQLLQMDCAFFKKDAAFG